MMKIEFLDLENRFQCRDYEEFVSSHPNGNFMQSLSWINVKPNWKHEGVIVRNQVGEIQATALVLIKELPILSRTLLYAPHGPVFHYNSEAALDALMKGIGSIAYRHGACLFRMDPYIEEGDTKQIDFYRRKGFLYKENPPERTTFQGRNTYILELDGRSEEEVLASFHPKWRYNIRLASRKGVQCIIGNECHLDDFYRLMVETGERDNFTIRPKEYFSRMMRALGGHCRLYMCYAGDKALSGAVTVQYGSRTSYVYGASSNLHRNLMPNYLMQWEMIRWAIEGGCSIYDFMGIPHYYNPEHPNYGVYRFKKGFNGRIAPYAGEFDFPYKPVTAHTLRFTQYTALHQLKKLRCHLL